jgi:hypothetical protein
MAEGGVAAVGSDEPMVGSLEVRRLEERIHELERVARSWSWRSSRRLSPRPTQKTKLATRVAEGRFQMLPIISCRGLRKTLSIGMRLGGNL